MKTLTAIYHRVIAEVQPGGDVLVMFEDGTVKSYRSPSTVRKGIARRDQVEANRIGNAAVMTEIDWRANGEPISEALIA